MPEVKWIKIVTEFFDDEKIKLIEDMPEADMILIIWIKLLTLAGKKNQAGFIFLTEKIPYTDEMLSTIFRRPLNTIRLALSTFEKMGMIEYPLKITNWEKHQNIEGMERVRDLNNKRAGQYRKRLTAVGGQNYLEHYNEIFKRDNGKCVYCGSNKNLCIDHLVAVIKGGDNQIDNLVLACKACNSGKSGKYLEETGYTFISNNTLNQYQKVKERLKITHSITQNHALDKIREDKIREDKEIKEVRKAVSASLKEKPPANNIEYDQELHSWHGIDEDIIEDWEKRFPNISVGEQIMKIREYFKNNPGKEKEILKKFRGAMPIYINDWLERAEKYRIENKIK